MCGKCPTCVVFSTWYVRSVNMWKIPHVCGKSHMCVENPTHVWKTPQMCEKFHMCVENPKWRGKKHKWKNAYLIWKLEGVSPVDTRPSTEDLEEKDK